MQVAIDKYEEYLINKGLKKQTIELYLYYFLNFQNVGGNLSNETVNRFLSIKTNRNSVGRAFILSYRDFLIQFHKELQITLDQMNDIVELRLPKISGSRKSRLIKPLSIEQIKLLETHLTNEKYKIMLLLSFYCGLRIGELLRIKVSSFNWGEWRIDTDKMGECRVLGKGDKEGIALVPSNLMKRIAKYIHNSKIQLGLESNLFIQHDINIGAEEVLNYSFSWRRELTKASVSAGITLKNEKGKLIPETVVHPHRLRHSCASYLLNEQKLDIREVQELLRHSSITSTQIYTHINKDKLKEKLANFQV